MPWGWDAAGNAIGTQTEAIVVRGLSLSRLSLRHLLGNEIKTGLLIGLTLAVLAFADKHSRPGDR